MNYVMNEFTLNEIENKIKEAVVKADDGKLDPNFRVGCCLGYLRGIKAELEDIKRDAKSALGRVTITWLANDVTDKFEERFGREPTEEEIKDIMENYLPGIDEQFDEVGEIAFREGLNKIESALEDWEEDNPQEEEE